MSHQDRVVFLDNYVPKCQMSCDPYGPILLVFSKFNQFQLNEAGRL